MLDYKERLALRCESRDKRALFKEDAFLFLSLKEKAVKLREIAKAFGPLLI